MEILRFEQVPESAPKRKKSSRGFLALGLVAALFGISTAFASSTITINADNNVNLGQGVVTVSGCDSNIGFKPVTKLSSNATDFQVTDFVIGYDWSTSNDNGLIDTTACNLKQMKISLYKDKVGGGVDLVPCWKTYKDASTSADAAGGNALKGSYVGIGQNGRANGNFAEYVTDFKCGTDGSFYFLIDKDTRNWGTATTMRIYWPDQVGFIFKADIFDHVTIESVSGETGLSGL
jgi:hypothetical protein